MPKFFETVKKGSPLLCAGEIYDPTGGEEDIKNGNPVRTTNNNPDVVCLS